MNKIDLLNKDQIKKIINDFAKSTKSEIILLSTLEKKSISKVKAKLLSYAT